MPRSTDDLIGVVELLRLRKMGDVTGMKHERRLIAQSALHPADGLLQRVDGVRICGLSKPMWLSLIWRNVKPF